MRRVNADSGVVSGGISKSLFAIILIGSRRALGLRHLAIAIGESRAGDCHPASPQVRVQRVDSSSVVLDSPRIVSDTFGGSDRPPADGCAPCPHCLFRGKARELGAEHSARAWNHCAGSHWAFGCRAVSRRPGASSCEGQFQSSQLHPKIRSEFHRRERRHRASPRNHPSSDGRLHARHCLTLRLHRLGGATGDSRAGTHHPAPFGGARPAGGWQSDRAGWPED